MNNLAVVHRIEPTHMVTIHEVDFALFATTNQQVRMRCAPNGIRQNKRATRTQVQISSVQVVLIERREVVRDAQVIEKEINVGDGHTYQLRILPYRTAEGKHEGAVVTLADFTRKKDENRPPQ